MSNVWHVPASDKGEAYLIRRAQSGDTDAVAELYGMHAPAIFRYCYFRVQDHAAAEDLTAEVFAKMVEALPRYVDRGAPLAAWLFRVAHDRVVDHHRRAASRSGEVIGETLETSEPGTETQAFARAEKRQLNQLIALLTEEQRTVIQLRFIEGYSLEDCARILDKTIGAIKALQHRALRQLARSFEQ